MTGLVELTEHTFSGGRPKRTEETANPGRTCKLHRKALPPKSYCEATVLTTDPSCCPIIVAHCYRFYLRAVISLFLFMQCSCQPPPPQWYYCYCHCCCKDNRSAFHFPRSCMSLFSHSVYNGDMKHVQGRQPDWIASQLSFSWEMLPGGRQYCIVTARFGS